MVVSRFMGSIIVHLREHAQDPYTGKVYPTKRGVSFTPSTWATLVFNANDIDVKVKELVTETNFEYRVHLGKAVFCTVTSGYYFVNIRRYFLLEGKLQPTKSGICLKLAEWNCLKGYFDAIKTTTPELAEALPCFFSADHANQQGDAECKICHPFGTEISYF